MKRFTVHRHVQKAPFESFVYFRLDMRWILTIKKISIRKWKVVHWNMALKGLSLNDPMIFASLKDIRDLVIFPHLL